MLKVIYRKTLTGYAIEMNSKKTSWQGQLLSIQPRIRLLRSFDQRQHNYLGYVLEIRGRVAEHEQEFTIGIGKGAQEKHQFRNGDVLKESLIPSRINGLK